MFARFNGYFVLLLSFTTASLAGEPAAPGPLPTATAATRAKIPTISAFEHLRAAAEQLDAAGLREEAAQLRKSSERIKLQSTGAIEELTRQIGELQKRSQQLRQLTGQPDRILCRCRAIELPAGAAAEFDAAAERVPSSSTATGAAAPAISLYKNAEQGVQQLRASGQVKIVADQQVITLPGQPATTQIGGEFPIVLPAADHQLSAKYLWFGFRCDVLPQLLKNGRVRLDFNPELAERDYANSVKANGLTIPGLTTRRAHVQMEMNLGETLVVRVPKSGRRDEAAESPSSPSVIRWVNALLEAAPPEDTVTLIMVTPVSAN